MTSASSHAAPRTLGDGSTSPIILFAHGSRDPDWPLPFREIQRLIAAARPALTIELAFLEFVEPSLEQSVERLTRAGHRCMIIAPLFMAQGGHLRHDLPQMINAIRKNHPAIEIRVLPPIGEVPAILAEISKWIVSAGADASVEQT